jgi:predicted amidophosphoribosyltransferase
VLRAPEPARPPLGIDAWAAPFAYEGPARELVARVKYRNVRAVVPRLSDRMSDAARAAQLDADVVTWAPTTTERRRTRGFDAAELLARAVARRMRRPVVPLLARVAGPPQTGLPAAARRVGPRFAARRASPASVLVVDDVATTGATLAAAAVATRGAGAARVIALTAARTPPPRSG